MVDRIQLPRLLMFLFLTQSFGEAQRMTQDALLMQYIERRIMLLEDRLEKCNQDMNKYVREFRDFRKEITVRLDRLNIYKTEFKNEMEVAGSRIDRIEKDIDYLESLQPTQPCVEVDERLIEEQIQQAEEKRKAKLRMAADCDLLLIGIKSLKIVKKIGENQGSWIKDPSRDFQKIYILSGINGDVFTEFAGIKAFAESAGRKLAKRVTLPFAWQGTGHVVYNGYLYFHRNGTLNQIVKFDIRNGTVKDRMLLQGAGRVPAYQLSPYTFIDLAVDEQGLWSIHAEPDDRGGTIIVTKIDHNNLAVEHSWDTSCSSKGAEAAFMICGTLYVVYNTHHGGRSHVQCLYDVTDVVTTADVPSLYFPKRYGKHSMIHYNPREHQLYAWDEGYQTIYKLITKKKLESRPSF
ncbi:olfactomedin-like protein 1 [Chiloscyllium plagiosum]|uniref:olfactomedin-like protein 1 n=1 Tax=Chiloscyllium plagiosum TaxID=36176 RepID=UPI001CB7FEEB|nr:olfactomedin-like protein 1 [Chiloscyllium plagiosum]